MVYHYAYYSGLANFAAAGTYAVYVFFVLSGFTLFYAYSEKLASSADFTSFFLARALRIMPLYAAVVTYQLLSAPISMDRINQYLLNITLLFGFSNPGETSMTPGGWSIGIEAVFYFLFPFIFLFRNVKAMAALAAASFALHFVYVHTIHTTPSDKSLWGSYTQAITFLCYFVAGVLGAVIFNKLPKFRGSIFVSLGLLLTILALPSAVGWSRADIIAGWPSVIMIALSISVVLMGARAEIDGAAAAVAEFLGDISYSLYLIHLIVFIELAPYLSEHGKPALLAVSAVVSLILSKILFTYFEDPIRRIRSKRRNRPHQSEAHAATSLEASR